MFEILEKYRVGQTPPFQIIKGGRTYIQFTFHTLRQEKQSVRTAFSFQALSKNKKLYSEALLCKAYLQNKFDTKLILKDLRFLKICGTIKYNLPMLTNIGEAMKKFLLVPDSFKGTLSSKQICKIIEERIKAHFTNANVISIPVADGGEGSVECFLSAMDGELITCDSVNPFFEKMNGFYGILNNGKTAVIEMSACAGLPLVENRKDPLKATTYGVGILIKDAILRGAEEIILGLGGSATNDFGCGTAAALGVLFYNENGEAFIPTGGSLHQVSRIDVSNIPPELSNIKITLMCDVKNPVYGNNGAAFVYAPQKGADPDQVTLLDEGLKHICQVVKRDLCKDVSSVVGGGAAGAMAGGMVAFFNASIRMGIDVVLETVGFDGLLEGADAVFTGEGKMDSQSLQGKDASAKGVPVIAVVGGVEGDISEIYDLGVNSVFTINRLPEDFSVSRHKSEENLRHTVDNVIRILKI